MAHKAANAALAENGVAHQAVIDIAADCDNVPEAAGETAMKVILSTEL